MDANNQTNTHIFTNRNGNTLMREFEGVLTNNPLIKNLDAVVGFLRASGYFSLRPFLNNMNKVRVLIGIDVDKYIVEANRKGQIFFGSEENVKEDCKDLIRKDIEKAGYKKEIEEGIFQMAEDLKSGRLELRAHPSKKIHAKLYVLYPDDFNQYSQAMFITGSSNLSGNGLGITQEQQYEFNVKLSQYDDVKFAKDEFEMLWEEAAGCEINADDVMGEIKSTYLNEDATPYEIYVKMLMEYFSGRVEGIDNEDPFDMPEGYSKYEYQTDAVIDGYQKLLHYDGFFLADVVGLGKTIVATMIAKKFLIENGRDNTKILVVYPPAVEQNWKATFNDFGIDKYTKFVSNGSLSKVLDIDNYDYWNPEEYDLILIDEAHKFRTHTTGAFKYMQEICKMPRSGKGNIPGYRKKVMLISATPMNNSPADIYNQILLFQDPRRCTIDGVSNLTAFFNPLIKEFKLLRKDDYFDVEKFRPLSDKMRDRIMKPITVRRTRTDIEGIARYRKDVEGFPKVERPFENRYEMNDHLADLFEDAMLTLNNHLNYSRYRAIAFLKPDVAEGLYDRAELVSTSLAGIRQTGLVKRLESSFYAFTVSIKSFRQANQNMIDMYKNGKVYITPDLDVNKMIEEELTEEEIEEKLNEKAAVNPKNAVFKAEDFDEKFIKELQSDQKLLDHMCSEWEKVTEEDDSKFRKFQDLMKHDLFSSKINTEGKLVVFSESADTVEYLTRRINRKDVLAISSKNRKGMFKVVCENFDANYKDRKNDYNILITTDALAEGVNLHRSNVIVNYDTPWNSTKLMQRIGRVNRIGSVSDHIYNFVFYPSREGNRVINLNEIALSKIQTFHSTFGEDNQIYSGREIIDHNLSELFDKTIKQEKEEVDLELPYCEELRDLYKNHRHEYNRIEKISVRSRTGRNARMVGGVTLSGDTLVFLKTNCRKLFFLVSEEVRELSVIEALGYFKAEKTEPRAERIPQHHEHVQEALEEFRHIQAKEITDQENNNQVDASSKGAQVTISISLLNSVVKSVDDGDLCQKMEQLKSLVERGTITSIAMRLQQIHKELQRGNKGKMNREKAIEEITEMAQKYAPYYTAEEALENITETDAEIILSESFTIE